MLQCIHINIHIYPVVHTYAEARGDTSSGSLSYFHLIVLRHRLSLNQVLSLIQSHFD